LKHGRSWKADRTPDGGVLGARERAGGVLMSADVLTLGPITFVDFSVPERMPFGGEHRLATHKLIGGQRVIDALGPDDRSLSWSGIFWGDNALGAAQEVDALRVLGQPLGLSWGGGSYVVLIESFTPDVQRLPTCVHYSITCVIAQNGAQGALGSFAQGVDSLVSGDLAMAASIIARAQK
jgi:hypothetical protein